MLRCAAGLTDLDVSTDCIALILEELRKHRTALEVRYPQQHSSKPEPSTYVVFLSPDL